VADPDAADAWAGTSEIGVAYQAAADARTPVAALRHAASRTPLPPAGEHRPLRRPVAAPVPAARPCCAGDWAY
jgi:hypothetical protein